jgi:hypothetical protein
MVWDILQGKVEPQVLSHRSPYRLGTVLVGHQWMPYSIASFYASQDFSGFSQGMLVDPRPIFEETLVGFDHFWTSTGWSKMECPRRAEIMGSHLFCGPKNGFIRVFVLGFWGCQPMGLPMIRPFVRYVKVYIGRNVM